MFASEAKAYPSATLRAGSCPYSQTIEKAGETCQRQTL